jgi:hypothetical protein
VRIPPFALVLWTSSGLVGIMTFGDLGFESLNHDSLMTSCRFSSAGVRDVACPSYVLYLAVVRLRRS